MKKINGLDSVWIRVLLPGLPFQSGGIRADTWMMRKSRAGKTRRTEHSVRKGWQVQRPWGGNELRLSED